MSEDIRPYLVVDETEYIYSGFQDIEVAYAFSTAIRRMDKSHSYSIVFQDDAGVWQRVEKIFPSGDVTSSLFTWTKRKLD